MTITKILETTLVAGQTSVSFTDAEIPNSILRVYPSDSDLIYESISLVSTTLTVTYPAQTANKSIALEIIKAGLEVIDNLTSTNTNNALSAKQGKTLNDAIVLVSGNLETLSETVNNLDIPDSITDLSDVNVTSIQDGQVLAWDDVSQKFVNVNQGASNITVYSTTPQLVGKWVDNSDVYLKVAPVTSVSLSANNWTSTGVSASGITNILSARLIIPGPTSPSVHYAQFGVIGGNIVANCFRNTDISSGYLILLYT